MTKKYSDEDSSKMVRLYSEGWTPKNIAEVMGLTRKEVSRHIYWKTMSPEKHERRLIRSRELWPNRRKREQLDAPSPSRFMQFDTARVARPPADVVAERDRRMSRGFNIRYDILGEPEPGRSALDQKQSEIRA